MTGWQTLIARVGLGSVAAIAGVWLTSSSRLLEMEAGRFDRVLFTAFAVSRLGIFLLVFGLLGIAPRGDVPAFYFEQALQVMRHLLPYRDFVSSYAPLHPYLDAALISVWRSPLAIMLFSVLVELAVLPVWLGAGREFLPERELRVASLLYLASPISLQFVAIDGQDNVVIAVLLGLAVLLVLRSREATAGAMLGVSVAAIKFLPLIYGPGFLLAVPRRWRLAAGALAALVLVYGGFLLLHTPILGPLAAEGDLRSAGDLPYVLEALFGVALPAGLTDGVLLLVLLGVFALMLRATQTSVKDQDAAGLPARLRLLTFSMAAVTLAFLVLSKKSWPPYLMLALFPVCLLVGTGGKLRTTAFSVFSVIAVTEHSYWASLLGQFSSMEFHHDLVAGHMGAVVMMGIEVFLLAGYFWLLTAAVQRIFEGGAVGAA